MATAAERVPRGPQDAARWVAGSDDLAARVVRGFALLLLFILIVQRAFGLSLTYWIDGIVLGSLYGSVGVGIVLIYRTNRIINFAAAALGALPAIAALLLDVQFHVSYLIVLPIALIGGPLIGGLI